MVVRIRVDAREVFDLASGWQELAQKFPAERMGVMRRIGVFARQQLMATYMLDLPLNPLLNYSQPTIYRGGWGESVRLWVTPQGTATLRIDSPYHDQMNYGSGPRTLDEGEKQRIKEWAYDKLGVDSDADVTRIIRKIETFGTFGRRLVEDAMNPGTPRGRRLDEFILRVVDEKLVAMLNDVGR